MDRGVLIWVQHLLGTGHLRRSLVIAEALCGLDVPATLVSGGAPVAFPLADGLRFEQLPAISAADQAFSGLVDGTGRPVSDELWQGRRDRLGEIVTEVRPFVLMTEMFPFGRRAFRHEVGALIDHVRNVRPDAKIVCSVRDILVAKGEPERYRWMLDLVRDRYDAILVHGDREFLAFGDTFPFAREIEAKIFYTGYVGAPPPAIVAPNRHGIIVSVGGGAVGRVLIEAAVAAARMGEMELGPWTIVTGNGMSSEEIEALRAEAPDQVTFERFVHDLPERIAAARLSISRAGYNTVAETLAAGTPMVLVPFETESETEQRTRAAAVERNGLGIHLPSDHLDAEALLDAVRRISNIDGSGMRIAMGGAERSAQWLHARLEEVRLAGS